MQENYTAWQLPVLNQRAFDTMPQKEQLTYFIALGSLAPSTHNTQPWRFSITPDATALNVFIDRRSILPASDCIGRQATISVGCSIENIVVAAAHYGRKATVQYVSPRHTSLTYSDTPNARYTLLARIKFSGDTDIQRERRMFTVAHILSRKVVRAEFDPTKKLPKKILDMITNIPDGRAVRVLPITDPTRRLALAEFQAQADGFVINTRRFAKELGDWLLPNDSSSPLGMPGNTFGLKDHEALRIHHGFTGADTLLPEDGLKFALAGKLGIEKSPYVGIITIARNDIGHWLHAGQVLEKIFLLLEQAGISVAIHAGTIEVNLINTMVKALLGTTEEIAVLFRAGWPIVAAHRDRPHSPRLSVDAVQTLDE